MNEFKNTKPSAINSVSVQKYRIMVELVDESDDIIQDRLIDLYLKSDNHYHTSGINDYCKIHYKKSIQEIIKERKK